MHTTTINHKYQVGEIVFFEQDNIIYKAVVKDITIFVLGETKISYWYQLKLHQDAVKKPPRFGPHSCFSDNELFKTPEDYHHKSKS